MLSWVQKELIDMKRLLALILMCLTLTGCTARPHLQGRWVTSPDDTLCGIVLEIEGNRFTLMQEGKIYSGSWSDDGGYIILHTDPLTPGGSGMGWSVPYDLEAGTLMLWGQTLYRE